MGVRHSGVAVVVVVGVVGLFGVGLGVLVMGEEVGGLLACAGAGAV